MPLEPLTPAKRRELTRSRLLEAAAEVFAARGFHGASLDEVAEAAGFTKGAVYSNFDSKDDLFLALVRQRQDAMVEEFFAATGELSEPLDLEAITEVFGRLSPDPVEWMLWEEFLLYAQRRPEVRDKLDVEGNNALQALVAMVEERWARAEVTPPLPPETLARLYLAVFDGVARQRALSPDRVPPELFATLVDFVNRAVECLAAEKQR